MDNQILEVLQRAPSFKKVVEEVCQDFVKLSGRVEELEKTSSVASQCQTNELVAKLSMEKAQAEAKALKVELDAAQRRAEEAETAKEEADEATSKLEELIELVKNNNDLENVLKELRALKVLVRKLFE